MSVDFTYKDPDIGEVDVALNPRSRRFVFRYRNGRVACTSPIPFDEARLRRAVRELLPRLLAMRERGKQRGIGARFSPDTLISTEWFCFRMVESDVDGICLRMNGEWLECHYPKGQDWDNPDVQQWLTKAVEQRLHMMARIVLPPRLETMAEQRGLHCNSVSVHKTKSRWGSCSSKGNINLSIYLLLVPRHLQDYVMHHELTHLLEMNHSERFWHILDGVTNGRSRQYREELKNFEPSLF